GDETADLRRSALRSAPRAVCVVGSLVAPALVEHPVGLVALGDQHVDALAAVEGARVDQDSAEEGFSILNRFRLEVQFEDSDDGHALTPWLDVARAVSLPPPVAPPKSKPRKPS